MLVLTNIIEKREIIITLDKKMLSDFEKKKSFISFVLSWICLYLLQEHNIFIHVIIV